MNCMGDHALLPRQDDQLAIVMQATGARPNELDQLISSQKRVPWGIELGLGLADYVTMFSPAGVLRGSERDDSLPHLTLRELLAHGPDSAFVDMVKSIEAALFLSWSSKAGGNKTVGAALKLAFKAAPGDGILNPIRQLALAVCPSLKRSHISCGLARYTSPCWSCCPAGVVLA